MKQVFATIVLLGLCGVSLARNGNFLMVRQTASKVGVLDLVDHNTGAVVREAQATFTFSWPYVQMTSSLKEGKIFTTTYPLNSSYPELYEWDSNLELTIL